MTSTIHLPGDIRVAESAAGTKCVECGSGHVTDAGPCRAFGGYAAGPAERAILSTVMPGRLFLCRSCGLGFRDPTPDLTQIADLYTGIEASQWKYQAELRPAWNLARKQLMSRFGNTSSTAVLDVGAFDGQFLSLLPSTWQRCALEPSDAATASYGRLGIERIGEFIGPPDYARAGQFDAVCLFDVFEHLLHPEATLAAALEYLRPGGWLLVSTGNCHHWSWRWLRGEHWYLDTVQHLRFASPQYFQQRASRLDVKIRQLKTVSHRQGSIGDRLGETCGVLYFGGRSARGWTRFVSRCAWWLSGHQWWKPRATVQYFQSLKDHLFVVLER